MHCLKICVALLSKHWFRITQNLHLHCPTTTLPSTNDNLESNTFPDTNTFSDNTIMATNAMPGATFTTVDPQTTLSLQGQYINVERTTDISETLIETQTVAAKKLVDLAKKLSNRQLATKGHGNIEGLLTAAATVAHAEGRMKDSVLAEIDECRLKNGVFNGKKPSARERLLAISIERDNKRISTKNRLRSQRTHRVAQSAPRKGTIANPMASVEGESQSYKVQVDQGSDKDENRPVIAGITPLEAHEVHCSVADKPCRKPGCTIWPKVDKTEECLPAWYPITLPDPLETWCSLCNYPCGGLLCSHCSKRQE